MSPCRPQRSVECDGFLHRCRVSGEWLSGIFAAVGCIDATNRVTVLPPLGTPRHGLGAAVVDDTAFVLLSGPQLGLAVSPTVEVLSLEG
ncbi:MAG: hypothetical protein ACRD0K_03540 [Egibacteraceae bacterium]